MTGLRMMKCPVLGKNEHEDHFLFKNGRMPRIFRPLGALRILCGDYVVYSPHEISHNLDPSQLTGHSSVTVIP
jgi:hypothetical protein